MKIRLILLFLLFSCVSEKNTNQKFSYYLTKNALTALRIESLVEKGKEITRPPRAVVDLVKIWSQDNICSLVRYQTPSLNGQNKGALFLEVCDGDNSVLAKLDSIDSLTLFLNRSLVLKGMIHQKRFTIEVPLLNIKKPKKMDILTSSTDKRYFDGVVVYQGNGLKNQKTLSAKNESYPEHKAIVCHDIDNKCEENSINNCSKCENGWYEVIGKYSCEAGLRKYCGFDQCGQKGWPACQRFHLPQPDNSQVICVDNSPYGFCNEGLNVYCVNDELICL